MATEVSQGSALAEQLQAVVQPKLVELGWSTGGLDDSALSEYIILMLVNGKSQDQIASELSEDLLNLGPEDAGAQEFSKWLFVQVNALNAGLHGGSYVAPTESTVSTESGMKSEEKEPTADAEMNEAIDGGSGSIPTGPKAMRNGHTNPRDKRMLGNINKTLDRSGDSPLHRVRGTTGSGRINSHSREPPKGPRAKLNHRNIQQMAGGTAPQMQMSGMMSNHLANGMSSLPPGQQMEMLAYWEQGARMMQQLMSNGGVPNGGPVFNPAFQRGNQLPQGKSLFDRVSKPRRQPKSAPKDSDMGGTNDGGTGMDFELSQPTKPASETRCRFDLSCTNLDCTFAHQSPAAKPGMTLDMSTDCSFGVACKNFKCSGKHPSPAKRTSFQSEKDCEWGPMCKNPTCHFRHSTMPPCRNGGDCTIEGCKFAHTRVTCVHNPCTRPGCAFKHADGQKKGKFGDKVWTAHGEGNSHVSERKFVDEEGEEELIIPGHQVTVTPGEAIIT
ncbi:hypothetical protein EJ05DRAFT_514593 [Pseudovirgaria hyperparasitica]|uniref:Nab2-like CCCH zinc finger domain-containing protein n=1 Tax=Pseudovirgaria hyperparasitica TaxID=470096 RepID=A0A6A6VTU4_9PEZI|nr:uncharacterized protein EJ05DRAFT_514593 [Pseudovirgaria hyperparasitica]KAF2753633.1 hypothetical protein EJ05DRAFT_514593 [Pseudovirgaria hyperparasitica]